MAFSLFDAKGIHVDKQHFTWRDLVQKPISKLDDDAFTRVRIILINGLEHEALRFGHMAARVNADLRLPLARVRRTEQHQATMVNWLVARDKERANSILYRKLINADGSPSEAVASGYIWSPGTELRRRGTVSAVGSTMP